MKEIVKWLNARGYRSRRGKTFGVGTIHRLLTNTVYIGRWKFNQKSSKSREKKQDEDSLKYPFPRLSMSTSSREFSGSYMPAAQR